MITDESIYPITSKITTIHPVLPYFSLSEPSPTRHRASGMPSL